MIFNKLKFVKDLLAISHYFDSSWTLNWMA